MFDKIIKWHLKGFNEKTFYGTCLKELYIYFNVWWRVDGKNAYIHQKSTVYGYIENFEKLAIPPTGSWNMWKESDPHPGNLVSRGKFIFLVFKIKYFYIYLIIISLNIFLSILTELEDETKYLKQPDCQVKVTNVGFNSSKM